MTAFLEKKNSRLYRALACIERNVTSDGDKFSNNC